MTDQYTSNHYWQISPSPVKLRYLQFTVGVSVLDIGMGRGFYAQKLQQRGYRVVGLDLHPQTEQEVNLSVVQARARALPFNVAFDTVLAFDVLEHEPNEKAALGELRRLTQGRLILSVPNADDTRLRSYNLTYKHHVDKSHYREYQAEGLRTRLCEAGFEVLKLQREGPVHPGFFAEFVRPAILRGPVLLLIKVLHRLRLLYQPYLMADLYAVAQPTS